jgi:hypothetical protein
MKKAKPIARITPKDIGFVLAGLCVFGAALAYIFIDRDAQWEAFKAGHHCRTMASDPSGRSWSCDDGRNYYHGGSLSAPTG